MMPTQPVGYETKGLYINGEWDTTGDLFNLHSPIDHSLLGTAMYGRVEHLAKAAASARNALDGEWSRWSPEDRASALRRLADLYLKATDHLAQVILDEVGTPSWFAHGPQVDHPLRIINYYANLADRYRFSDSRHNGGTDRPGTIVNKRPVGAVGIITPWNMPQKTIMMKMAPALAAGCTVVIKPAPETPFDAMILAELCDQAGFPPGVVNVVPAMRTQSAYLPTSTYLDKIAFTGSTTVGRAIAQVCGMDIRRYSLELGGKSPTILLPDADLDAWQASVPTASLLNNGQICSNQTRIICPQSMEQEVLARLRRVLATKYVVGDPRQAGSDCGPLITATARNNYERALVQAREDGCSVDVPGIGIPDELMTSPGNWVAPAIVHNLPDRHSSIWRNEVFGPVLAVMPYYDLQAAVELANDSMYGLHAGIWSERKSAAYAVANKLRVGQIQINGAEMPLHTPLGGFKESGWGRELGPEGMDGYLETSAVVASW